MSANKGLLLQSIYSTFARFAGVGLNLIVNVLIARLLNVSNAGDIMLLMTFITGVSLFSRIGVEQLIVKEIASAHDSQTAFRTQFLKGCYKLVLLSSLLFFVIWALLGEPIRNVFFHNNVDLYNLILAGSGILFFNLVTVNSFYLKAIRQTVLSVLMQNALPAIAFLLLILLFWADFSSNQMYIKLYTYSLVIAGIASVLIILPWIDRKSQHSETAPSLQSVINRSLPLAPVSMISFTMLWADTVMVGMMLEDKVALYKVAAFISYFSLFFLAALDATIYPRLLSISRHQPEKLRVFFWKATFLVVVALLGISLLMAVFARLGLSAFGPEYTQATSVLLILLAAQWLRATSLTFGFMFIIREQVRYLNIILFIALVINLLSNATLIPIYGMEGAAIATLLANGFLAGTVVLLFYYKKLLAENNIPNEPQDADA